MFNKKRVILLLIFVPAIYANDLAIQSKQRPMHRYRNITHAQIPGIYPIINPPRMTTNSPSTDPSLFKTHPFLASVICIIVTLMIVCTLIGNAMVCLAICLVRKLKQQPANLLLTSLAVADFCVGLIVMPIALSRILYQEWLFGKSSN